MKEKHFYIYTCKSNGRVLSDKTNIPGALTPGSYITTPTKVNNETTRKCTCQFKFNKIVTALLQ